MFFQQPIPTKIFIFRLDYRKKWEKLYTEMQKAVMSGLLMYMCGAHICWDCMKAFQNSEETYSHLEAVYGLLTTNP